MDRTDILRELSSLPATGTAYFTPLFDGFDSHEFMCHEDLALWIETHLAGGKIEVNMVNCEGVDSLVFYDDIEEGSIVEIEIH